jgi:hypothetical protein
VIQIFSSATKGTIQSDTNFQVLYLQKKKQNQYKVIQIFSSATKGKIQSDTKIFKCHKKKFTERYILSSATFTKKIKVKRK